MRGYLASNEKHWKLSWVNVILLILLAGFYASIPGITRVTVGDPSDGLEKKKFITAKEWEVEVGALVVNTYLMIALMYTIEVQYSKHMEHYREWMYELTMFLMNRDNQSNDILGNGFGNRFGGNYPEHSYYEKDREGKYLPNNLYLSLKRRSNALGWMELRSFMACQGILFFGEQGIVYECSDKNVFLYL